jgi:branched-chain amino acid transport system permease protein
MTTPLLEARGIHKWFGGLHALDDASFAAYGQRVTALVGPNGAGKTTLFNVIAGAFPADAGEVRWKGEDIIGQAGHRRLSLGIGRTFQDVRLIDELTAEDNIALGLQHQPGERMSRLFLRPWEAIRAERQTRERVFAEMERFGLLHAVGEPVVSLSYGDQKLVSMARLTVADPEVLLLDEPASGLDGASLEGLTKTLQQLVETGRTVILVEHNMSIVAELADHVIFLEQGRTIAEGTPEEIMNRDELRDIYFGA